MRASPCRSTRPTCGLTRPDADSVQHTAMQGTYKLCGSLHECGECCCQCAAACRIPPALQHDPHPMLCRQPSVLLLAAPSAPGQPGTALCAELAAVGASLAHLELSSPTATWLAGLGPGLEHLSCLSLGSCPNLSTGAIQQLLQQLPQVGRGGCCLAAGACVPVPRAPTAVLPNCTVCPAVDVAGPVWGCSSD